MSFIGLLLLTSCTNNDLRRYNNTLNRLDYGCLGKSRMRRDALTNVLKDAHGPEGLKTPRIAIAYYFADGRKIGIILHWVSLMPMANGVILKSKKGEVNYLFPDVDLEYNKQMAQNILIFNAVIFFTEKEIPSLIYDKNVSVILSKDGVPISNEFPLEIIHTDNKKETENKPENAADKDKP